MAGKFGLDGGIIRRKVKRMLDGRSEPRFGSEPQTATLVHRGRSHAVSVGNISSSGAMVVFAEVLDIGEPVTLQLLDHGAVAGQVRWVRDGHVGINFIDPLE